MISQLNCKPYKISGFGLVRDKDGNVKIDDIDNIPKQIKDLLTDRDWSYINGRNTPHNCT